MEEEFEEMYNEEHQHINNQVKIAVGYKWGLSDFKSFISKFLKRENNEDQWTHDYESWVLTLNEGEYEHPRKWAEDYYNADWDFKKMNTFIISLSGLCKIAKRDIFS